MGQGAGFFHRGSGADDGRKPGGGAVDEFNAAFPQDDVVGRADPDFFRAFVNEIFAEDIKIRLFQDTDGLEDFFGKQGSQTGIQSRVLSTADNFFQPGWVATSQRTDP